MAKKEVSLSKEFKEIFITVYKVTKIRKCRRICRIHFLKQKKPRECKHSLDL